MSAGKIGNSEILCINVARCLQLAHPDDERSKSWSDIDDLSVEQCKWCLAEYEAGRSPTFDEILKH